MKFIRASRELGIGILVLIAVFIIFPPLGQIFLLSVVCTVGLALIVWLPVAYVIGFFIYTIIAIFTKPADRGKDRVALENYVCHEKASGVSEDEIRAALKEKGWAEGEIEKVFHELSH